MTGQPSFSVPSVEQRAVIGIGRTGCHTSSMRKIRYLVVGLMALVVTSVGWYLSANAGAECQGPVGTAQGRS
jgi:hypothetical protein